jgi:Ca-activated chloride channel family protein
MWQFLVDNKEAFAVVAALVTGVFAVIAAVVSKKKTIIHQIVEVPSQIPAPPASQPPVTPPVPAQAVSPPEPAEEISPSAGSQPRIELTTTYPAVRMDSRTTLDVLVRIIPPASKVETARPTVNLGLVLDHSGSMSSENKMGYAREAAIYAVQQLRSSDRVSVTIFDDKVETIVPSTPMTNPARIVQLIQQVKPGNSTALYAGWLEGCKQVSQFQVGGGLNRVLLLSDGIANVGETNSDVIATQVKNWSQRGVSSTAMGVGNDYNEDLLEAVALSGDGNYYYIQSPGQLPDIFRTELQGLLRTVGSKVSLGIEPQNGVTVTDVLNDLEKTEYGRLKLSNLISSLPIEVVVRLSVPPMPQEAELCRFRLAWDAAGAEGRQVLGATLSRPVKAWSDWNALTANPEVEERAVLLLVARLKKQATEHLAKGDRAAAERCLSAAKELLGTVAGSLLIQQEAADIAKIDGNLARGEVECFTKEAKYQHYWRTHTRPRN